MAKKPDLPKAAAFEIGDYPYKEKMKRKHYEEELVALQIELLKVQRWAKETGQRFLLIFEGRDAPLPQNEWTIVHPFVGTGEHVRRGSDVILVQLRLFRVLFHNVHVNGTHDGR